MDLSYKDPIYCVFDKLHRLGDINLFSKQIKLGNLRLFYYCVTEETTGYMKPVILTPITYKSSGPYKPYTADIITESNIRITICFTKEFNFKLFGSMEHEIISLLSDTLFPDYNRLTIVGRMLFLVYRSIYIVKEDTKDTIQWKFKAFHIKDSSKIIELFNKSVSKIPPVMMINLISSNMKYIQGASTSGIPSGIDFKESVNKALTEMGITIDMPIIKVINIVTRWVDISGKYHFVYWLVNKGLILDGSLSKALYTTFTVDSAKSIDIVKYIQRVYQIDAWACKELNLSATSLDFYNHSPLLYLNKFRTGFNNIDERFKGSGNRPCWRIARDLAIYPKKVVLDLRIVKKLEPGTYFYDSIYDNVVLRYDYIVITNVFKDPAFLGNGITRELRRKYNYLNIPIDGLYQSTKLIDISKHYSSTMGKMADYTSTTNKDILDSLDSTQYKKFFSEMSSYIKSVIASSKSVIYYTQNLNTSIRNIKLISIILNKYSLTEDTVGLILNSLKNITGDDKDIKSIRIIMDGIFPRFEETMESIVGLGIVKPNTLVYNPMEYINSFRREVDKHLQSLMPKSSKVIIPKSKKFGMIIALSTE